MPDQIEELTAAVGLSALTWGRKAWEYKKKADMARLGLLGSVKTTSAKVKGMALEGLARRKITSSDVE